MDEDGVNNNPGERGGGGGAGQRGKISALSNPHYVPQNDGHVGKR